MRFPFLATVVFSLFACHPAEEVAAPPTPPPSILLVTLDTTRADSIGPEADRVTTPAFDALASTGARFRQAYATAPQTLPSHASMLTGLYPAGHGIHENARYLGHAVPLIAERLRDAGYATAAFVSAYPLARQFGLHRGFEIYDDALPDGATERSAASTTDRAIAWLSERRSGPRFLWVHYFEPHHPYEPPEPFRSEYAENPYLGEIGAMDRELGRLIEQFEKETSGPAAVLVAGDHGESLGEHGEAQHGNLVYQGAMHVPLVIAGPGVEPATIDTPVSIRRVFHTILDWAGVTSDQSLRRGDGEVVLGEAMQPFLQYGWQPQVMAVEGRRKVIQAGGIEIYDPIADPGETNDLSGGVDLSRAVRQALREYPLPSAESPADGEISEEDRRQLASLGYVSSVAAPPVRADAPRPADMAHLFGDLERASTLFVREEYAKAIPLLERILAADPGNLSAALRLAAAHSALGHSSEALAAFRRAEAIAPDSADVRHFLALHHLKSGDAGRAAPLLERVLEQQPNRLPTIEALASVRERQGRIEEALRLRQKALAMKSADPTDEIRVGELAMATGNTTAAIEALENARAMQGPQFRHDLELGVLYLDARRLPEAREALDRVPASHPAYPMALFKRAQVSVLLNEPNRAERIAAARRYANPTTRELIARESLFQSP